ncbi:hypothetical protein BKA61DRAFT_55197 [Leptodontidium sp. MPI-SDFR-AT-0119]|nr:hypothetical protein BKA61DRAFT_55197 [Leptodontidium sp. MPI-SDFR-AT-0119]
MDSYFRCLRCRVRKISCSKKTPSCRQCVLAGNECTYDRKDRRVQHQQRQRKSAAAESNPRIDEDKASNISIIKDVDDKLVYTSIETTEQKQPLRAVHSSSLVVPSRRDVGDFHEFSIGGQIVQYLFEPTNQLLPSFMIKNATWQDAIGTKLRRMLVDLPLGKSVVSTIGAPFFDNQYAGAKPDFSNVHWRKSFVVARRISPQQRGGTAGMRTVLRKHIKKLLSGRCELMPRDQEVEASINLFDSDLANLRNTPPPQIKEINLQPSPTPPPTVPLPPIHGHSSLSPKPSQGDAVLIASLDNGRVTDISRRAGKEMLPSDAEAHPLQSRGIKRVLKNKSRKKLRKELRRDLMEGLRKELRKELRLVRNTGDNNARLRRAR